MSSFLAWMGFWFLFSLSALKILHECSTHFSETWLCFGLVSNNVCLDVKIHLQEETPVLEPQANPPEKNLNQTNREVKINITKQDLISTPQRISSKKLSLSNYVNTLIKLRQFEVIWRRFVGFCRILARFWNLSVLKRRQNQKLQLNWAISIVVCYSGTS